MFMKAEIGKKYNKLTVVEIISSNRAVIVCDCGNIKEMAIFSIIHGRSKTCGCEQRSSRIKHKEGDKHGRLTITKRVGSGKVEAQCECGKVGIYALGNVIKGVTTSCGCYNSELHTKHGGCDHPLYSVWEGIIQRCHNTNHKKYKNYGALGITMCDEWRNDFNSFKIWALDNGWVKGLKIDKDIKAPKNGPKIYSPDHCSIITQKENTRNTDRNRIIEYNGISMCVAEWADKLGIKYYCLIARIKRGWDIERAFKKEDFSKRKHAA